MKRKADLFQLIKAMSKSEKRYFTLDAQKSGRKDARYLELFQAINDMESYDESILKNQFGKTLPADKAYLYEAILRSMRDYRSANSYAASIKEMIMDAKYLYERGLYDQSEERLIAAQELADELGDQLSVIELNKEHRRLVNFTKKKGYEQKLLQLIVNKEENLYNLKEEIHYLDLLDRIVIEVRKNPHRLDTNAQEALRAQFSELFTASATVPNSIQGKLRFYQCMGLIYQLLGDKEQTYYYFKKVVECWDSSPKFKQEEFFRYILDVSNLLHVTFSDPMKAEKLPELLTKLEEEDPTHFHDRKALFQQITSYRLIYAINTGDFHDVHRLVHRIDKGLKQYNLAYNSEIVINFNVALLLFMAHEFASCKEWTDRIITKINSPIRRDIQYAVRIVNIIATLELNDFDEVELVIRNTARYLNKNKDENSDFNNNILKFSKDLHQSNLLQDKKGLKKFKDYLLGLRQRNIKVPLGIDELLLYWVESKIEQRTISSIIKSSLSRSSS